jgi:polyhydroxyalkanoate synthesis regulator phasin
MPKKKPGMTPEEQSEKFREAVRELEAAGELNLTEAAKVLDQLLKKGSCATAQKGP